MSDENQAPTEEVKAKAFGAEDVLDRKIFSPDEMQAAVDYFANVSTFLGEEFPTIQYTGDSIPQGYGMGVFILKEQKLVEEVDPDDSSKMVKANRRVPKALVIWPAPTVEVLAASEQGVAFISQALQATITDAILRPFRNKEIGDFEGLKSEVPISLSDFTESKKREGLYVVYNQLAKPVVKHLQKQYSSFTFFRMLTPTLLRECLSHSDVAMEYVSKAETAGLFVQILNQMKKLAEANKLSPQVFDSWLATRDEPSFAEVQDVDFGAFAMAAEPASAPTPDENVKPEVATE